MASRGRKSTIDGHEAHPVDLDAPDFLDRLSILAEMPEGDSDGSDGAAAAGDPGGTGGDTRPMSGSSNSNNALARVGSGGVSPARPQRSGSCIFEPDDVDSEAECDGARRARRAESGDLPPVAEVGSDDEGDEAGLCTKGGAARDGSSAEETGGDALAADVRTGGAVVRRSTVLHRRARSSDACLDPWGSRPSASAAVSPLAAETGGVHACVRRPRGSTVSRRIPSQQLPSSPLAAGGTGSATAETSPLQQPPSPQGEGDSAATDQGTKSGKGNAKGDKEKDSTTSTNNDKQSSRNGDKPDTTAATATPSALRSRYASARDITMFIRAADEAFGSDELVLDAVMEAEEMLSSLPDVSYDVIKVNMRGRAQRRILRLRPDGLHNIKRARGGKETLRNVHAYRDVGRVGLEGLEKFTIYYNNDHDFRYRSPIALQIVQEISSRVAIRHTAQKKLLTLSDPQVGLEMQKRLSQKLGWADGGSGGNGNSNSNSNAAMLLAMMDPDDDETGIGGGGPDGEHGAERARSRSRTFSQPMPVPRRVRSGTNVFTAAHNESGGDGSDGGDGGPGGRAAPGTPPRGQLSRTGAHAASHGGVGIGGGGGGGTLSALDRRNFQKSKLLQMLGETQEQRLDRSLNQILLDSETPEGRTIAHYLKGFGTVENNPATAASSVRQFLDGMRQYVAESRGAELAKLVVHADTIPDQEESPEEILQDRIERALQQAIVSPIHDRLVRCIQSQVREQELLFEERRKLVMGKPQAVFGIPHAHASRTRWAGAMLELSSLERARTPAQKMDVLLRTAKAIYKTYVAEHSGTGNAERFLAGDDFLPIFIYVICNSHASKLEMTAEYLYNLSNQAHLSGEGGYYLTVFSSSLMFLKTHEWTAEELSSKDNLPRMNSQNSIYSTVG